jgi:hypothetical protein
MAIDGYIPLAVSEAVLSVNVDDLYCVSTIVFKKGGYSHEDRDLHAVQECHAARPPSTLLNSPVKAPRPEFPGGANMGSLRRFLTANQLFQIDPLALLCREQRHSRSRTEIADDNSGNESVY